MTAPIVRSCRAVADQTGLVDEKKVVPGCLTEGQHHRIWWDVICFEVCPHHRLRLVSETEKGGKVRTFWPHFDIAPTAENWGEELERLDPVDPTLETFIENRWAGRAPMIYVITSSSTLLR